MVYTERLERLFPGQKVSGVIPVSLPPHRTGAVGVGRHIRRRRLPGVPASWTGAGRRRRWRRGRRRWLERSKGKKRGRGDYSSVVIVSLVKRASSQVQVECKQPGFGQAAEGSWGGLRIATETRVSGCQQVRSGKKRNFDDDVI